MAEQASWSEGDVMSTLRRILKELGTFIFTLAGPFVLVIVGVLLAAVGLYNDWGWLTSGGAIASIFGVLRIFHMAGLGD